MLILIDNGHGLMTPGKRSPYGQFCEAFKNVKRTPKNIKIGNYGTLGFLIGR